MLLEELWRLIDKKLLATPSKPDLFNFYRDADPVFDVSDAAKQRRANLRDYLRCYETIPDIFVLAEAPGPWGCRFSGVPVTSEAQLTDPDFPIRGSPTSLKPDPLKEYTARIYWRVLGRAFPHFMTWNAVPLHPHHSGKPMSIRAPRVSEIRYFIPLLEAMLDILKPGTVLAMGRTAERALKLAGWSSKYVRHPSQGGAKIFERQVQTVLNNLNMR